MIGNDYKLIKKKNRKDLFSEENWEVKSATVEKRERQETRGEDRRKLREDELNKRLNNTHQGLINCCSMGATSWGQT